MDFIVESDSIYLEDTNGKHAAEITFEEVDRDTVAINHTFVDDSLRGQGIAGKLMQKAMDVLEKRQKKVVPSCSYAANWLQKHPEYADRIADR